MASWASQATVVIPTRDRGDAIAGTVRSLLGNQLRAHRIVVVDQSTHDETERALDQFAGPGLTYVRSPTRGASAARNEGLALVDTDYVVFTDDDCIVPPTWVETIVATLASDPRAAMTYCSVVAGHHDAALGTIPNHAYTRRRVVRHLSQYASSIGMAAGLAARRDALEQLGGFDEFLGPGGPFRSGEDHDLAIRALAAGWAVIETPETAVVHEGFRSTSEFRVLTGRDWFGIGACHGKHLRDGRLGVLPIAAYNVLVRALLHPALRLLHLQRPQGLRRLVYYAQGFRRGWSTPIDPRTGCFRAHAEAVV